MPNSEESRKCRTSFAHNFATAIEICYNSLQDVAEALAHYLCP